VLKQDADGRLVAEYFGLERMGEHGLFYTAVQARAVAVDADGNVRLTIPARRLFRTRPASLAEAAKLEAAGSTKDELALTGRRVANTLELSCSGPAGSCPDSRMVFRRRH
jgi:hypothetical protein